MWSLMSREPFVQSYIGHSVITEPYALLQSQVSGMVDRTVQDAFRCTTNCWVVVDQSGVGAGHPCSSPSFSVQDVSAILVAQNTGGVSQMGGTGPDIPQLASTNRTASLPWSEINQQEQDDVLCRILFCIQHHWRPTSCEHIYESRGVIQLLRHWPKLSINYGMLYRVKKDRQRNMMIHQVIVPDSLKAQFWKSTH